MPFNMLSSSSSVEGLASRLHPIRSYCVGVAGRSVKFRSNPIPKANLFCARLNVESRILPSSTRLSYTFIILHCAFSFLVFCVALSVAGAHRIVLSLCKEDHLSPPSDRALDDGLPVMLTRAARRRQALRYARNVAQQIELPFLCPALSLPHTASVQQRPLSSRPLPKARNHLPQPTHARQLASAAPLPESHDWHDNYNSHFYSNGSAGPVRRKAVDSTLPVWDPSLRNLLHIDTSTVVPHSERINTRLKQDADVRGNSTEVEDNLEACVSLGKWERAVRNLNQLKIMYHTDKAKLRRQYNYVLASMVDEVIEHGGGEVEEYIAQWIDRDMRRAGLEPDAEVLALVIKGALAIPSRSKRDRTVRRFWDMTKRCKLQGEVGTLRAILTERDLGIISQICPLEAQHFAEFVTESLDDGGDEPDIVLSEHVVAQRPELHIRETEQKGEGMSSLRQTLSLFQDEDDRIRLHSQLNPEEQQLHSRQRQARLEHDAVSAATERWKKDYASLVRQGISPGLNTGNLGVLMWQWHEVMREKIIDELKRVEEAEQKDKKSAQDKLRLEYGPFLQQLEPGKLAAITAIAMVQIMNRAGATKPVPLVRLVTELGKLVESERHAEVLTKRAQVLRKGDNTANLATYVKRKDLSSVSERPGSWGVTTRSNHHAAQKYLQVSEWTTSIHLKLGAVLAELFMDTARIRASHTNEATGKTITIAQPIFVRQKQFSAGKKVGTVSLHESFIPQLIKEPSIGALAKQLPMVCEPSPWTDFAEGGYLQTPVPVMRVKNRESLQKDYAFAAAANGDLDQIFAGLDVLGKVPWRINKDIFEVMAQAWNTGEEIAGLAPLQRVFEVPERPPAEAPNKVKHEWFTRMRQIENRKNGDHSERCFQALQMEVAKAYLHETFYLPHNMDFRGRAYPIPPYLNQMGADNSRGLLLFAKGRPLGERGLWWLKVHLSNVYGYDKASLSDRAQFPMTHMEEIRDSVARPFIGKKWWLGAEDPWQCLATCQELVRALDSPIPEEYVSHLPVHQDGSCNGLQHYAALGGDPEGARQVNLEPGDKPADVYTGVCDLVAAAVAEDAKAGHEVAKLLDGRLKRKIVKQTVMTNVYGVTYIGAAAQVRKQLDDLLPDLNEQRQSAVAALYLANKIFKALGELFNGAHRIQYWLGDCANRISCSVSPAQLEKIAGLSNNTGPDILHPGRRRENTVSRSKVKQLQGSEFRSTVIWTTPLKLPVAQPYRKVKGAKVRTNLQSITLFEPTVADSVDKRKQLQAFPPNFIHSLDATHMLLSALKSDERGLTFAAVHDSFWTHAADIDTMSKLLRDAFIRMHSEDIIGRLAAEFRKRYEGHLYLAQVSRHNKFAEMLKEYRKGVSKRSATLQKNDELLREIEKRRLMASEDAGERQKGEEMVTAATLFEKFGGEKHLVSTNSLGQTAMATVPGGVTAEAVSAAAEDVAASEGVLSDAAELDNDISDAEADEADEASAEELKGVDPSSSGTTPGQKKAKRNNDNNKTWLWLPLTFPAVPKRGEFDVRRLKDSQYFFS